MPTSKNAHLGFISSACTMSPEEEEASLPLVLPLRRMPVLQGYASVRMLKPQTMMVTAMVTAGTVRLVQTICTNQVSPM